MFLCQDSVCFYERFLSLSTNRYEQVRTPLIVLTNLFKTAFQWDAYRSLRNLMCFQWPPPDVGPRGRGVRVGNQLNNFEQASNDPHQMSLEEGRSLGLTSRRRGGGRSDVPYPVAYPMMHLMLPTPPPDRQTPVKTLPSRNFVCGW